MTGEKILKFGGLWLGVPAPPLFLIETHAQIPERGEDGLIYTYLKIGAKFWRKGEIREHKWGWRDLCKLSFQPLSLQSRGLGITAPATRGQHRPETGLRMWMGEGWPVVKSSGQ